MIKKLLLLILGVCGFIAIVIYRANISDKQMLEISSIVICILIAVWLLTKNHYKDKLKQLEEEYQSLRELHDYWKSEYLKLRNTFNERKGE